MQTFDTNIDLKDFGWRDEYFPTGAAGIPGRVTAAHRDRVEVLTERGPCEAKLRGSAAYRDETMPVTGDWVLLDWQEGDQGRIARTLPRKTALSRPDAAYGGNREQVVAANFDVAFLLTSLNHDFNLRRMERYLTAAWQSGAMPVVVLTKRDLMTDCNAQLRAAERVAVGAPVYAVSSATGEGLDALQAYLKPGTTVVFLGSSGVGKSSLVNALAGENLMITGGIREDDSRGRHTTTHRQLLRLRSGALVIDTPGMRALGMWDVSEGLGESFADVEQYFGRCRFRDCRHQSEPGCAIRAAIESGELLTERWESYQNLKREAKYSDDPDSYLRDKSARHKQIAKFSRELKKRKL